MPPRRTFVGRPSTPGWKRGRLEGLTDWATADEANRPIICEYEPDGLWLWTRYRGTVLSITIVPVLFTMGLGVVVDYAAHSLSTMSWPLLAVPPADAPFIPQLQGFNSLWEYQLQLCTLILTFFTSQAYSHWRLVYFTTRAIQGRINDICLLITIGAAREGNEYSDEAAKLVQLCTRLIRMSHTFFWAATPSCSNAIGAKNKFGDFMSVLVKDQLVGSAKSSTDEKNSNKFPPLDEEELIGPLLLSAEGLKDLVNAEQLTSEEVESLLATGLPPSQYSYILLEWVGLYAMNGLREGTLRCDNGFEENLLRQLTALRGEYFNIGDYTAGRMPLAYVQLVQVLVDSLVYSAPFSLYSELGGLSIPLVGLLTLFFKGLLELSKSFLDAFGNEGFPGQNIRVDVLVSELNFGAGSRWVEAGAVLPSQQK